MQPALALSRRRQPPLEAQQLVLQAEDDLLPLVAFVVVLPLRIVRQVQDHFVKVVKFLTELCDAVGILLDDFFEVIVRLR